MAFQPLKNAFLPAPYSAIIDRILTDDRLKVLIENQVMIVSSKEGTATEFDFGQFFDNGYNGQAYRACRKAIALLELAC